MANNIPKDILEPETAPDTEPSVFVALPGVALSEAFPALPADTEGPLPANVLLSPEQEQRRKQTGAFSLRGTRHQPGPNDWKKTVGMFKDDLEAMETAAEGRRIRESRKSE